MRSEISTVGQKFLVISATRNAEMVNLVLKGHIIKSTYARCWRIKLNISEKVGFY